MMFCFLKSDLYFEDFCFSAFFILKTSYFLLFCFSNNLRFMFYFIDFDFTDKQTTCLFFLLLFKRFYSEVW